MFACAIFAKSTICKTVKQLQDFLKDYDPDTLLQCGFEMGVSVHQMENKDDRSEIYISFEESEELDDEDEEEI